MRWRFITAVLLGASFALGQPTTQIDTVLVTPVFLKLVDNSGGIYKYRGKVSYRIIGWAYDRFNVSVSIIKDGTGEVVPLTMTMGDIGPLTWQGEKGIHFGCQFNGAPSGTYKAKISIALSQSDTAVFIESKIASMSNGDKQTIVNGGSAAGVVGLRPRRHLVFSHGPRNGRHLGHCHHPGGRLFHGNVLPGLRLQRPAGAFVQSLP